MKKILLIRFSSIGDVVLTTPVIRGLKQQIDCELHVLIKRKFGGVLSGNPYPDKIHTFDVSPDEILDVLKKEDFDFVVDLQKNLRSMRLRNQLKKPDATFQKLNIKKWLLVNLKINRLPCQHIVDRYFEAVKTLNVKNDGQGLDYFIPHNDRVMLKDIDAALEKGYAAFVIGGRHNTKILPPEKVVSIIDRLAIPVILLGGSEDAERASLIAGEVSKNKVFNTCGKLGLNQSASLVQQAKVVISNDTGLMHIAAAFKKPVISIWGNTVPDFGMYPYLPGKNDLSYVSEVKGLKCRPCSKLGYQRCPKKHFRCMLDQDENMIVQKAMEFSQGTSIK